MAYVDFAEDTLGTSGYTLCVTRVEVTLWIPLVELFFRKFGRIGCSEGYGKDISSDQYLREEGLGD